MSRTWYEVRVREQIGPNEWVKKSKFFNVRGSREAAEKYRGRGLIMWCEKVSREKLLGIGDFFNLGGDLLRELQEDRSLLDEVRGNGRKNKKRGYHDKRKEATD